MLNTASRYRLAFGEGKTASTLWSRFSAIALLMAGMQAPKGFGILFAIVGVPLILWSASRANGDLDALNKSSSTGESRVEQCIAKTAQLVPDLSIRRPVCECMVAKAKTRGAFKDYGAYDMELLEPVIGECLRGDWD